MKNKALIKNFTIAAFLLLSVSVNAQIVNHCIGRWNFKCPFAPEGFDTGIIEIRKDSVFTTFSGIKYKFPSTWIKPEKDTLRYNVNINGEDVLYLLKMENKDTLNGTTATSYGKSPLILTRE